MRVVTQIILQLSLLTAVQPASAQSPITQLPNGPTSGVSLERFQYEDAGAIAAVTYHRSRLRHNGFGSEFGLSVFPQYLRFPSLVTAPEAGVGYNISVPAATLLLRGGLGALLGIGGGLSLFPGAHLGGSALVQVDQRLALRADVLKRWYRIAGETERFWSMGIGFSVLHE